MKHLATIAAVSPVPISNIFLEPIFPTFSSARLTAISPIDFIPIPIPVEFLISVAILIELSNNLSSTLPEFPACLALEDIFLISSNISSFPTTTDSIPDANRNRLR